MNENLIWWNYILTVIGLIGFYFVGKQYWWAWIINISCQLLWAIYAVLSAKYGFLFAAAAYTVIFSDNLYKWYKKRKNSLENRTDNESTIGHRPHRIGAKEAD